MSLQVRPFLLSATGTVPWPAAIDELLHNATLWWATKGVAIEHTALELGQFSVDPQMENPWPKVWSWLHDHGYIMDGSELFLVFLNEWAHPSYVGWGGSPLTVAGDYALRFLRSVGTPEAIVDDSLAGFLICHEGGHALGLAHDFQTRNSVMSYDWTLVWNFIIGTTQWRALRKSLKGKSGELHVQGCQLRYL